MLMSLPVTLYYTNFMGRSVIDVVRTCGPTRLLTDYLAIKYV